MKRLLPSAQFAALLVCVVITTQQSFAYDGIELNTVTPPSEEPSNWVLFFEDPDYRLIGAKAFFDKSSVRFSNDLSSFFLWMKYSADFRDPIAYGYIEYDCEHPRSRSHFYMDPNGPISKPELITYRPAEKEIDKTIRTNFCPELLKLKKARDSMPLENSQNKKKEAGKKHFM